VKRTGEKSQQTTVQGGGWETARLNITRYQSISANQDAVRQNRRGEKITEAEIASSLSRRERGGGRAKIRLQPKTPRERDTLASSPE